MKAVRLSCDSRCLLYYEDRGTNIDDCSKLGGRPYGNQNDNSIIDKGPVEGFADGELMDQQMQKKRGSDARHHLAISLKPIIHGISIRQTFPFRLNLA